MDRLRHAANAAYAGDGPDGGNNETIVITTQSTNPGEFDSYCRNIFKNHNVVSVSFSDCYVPNAGVMSIAHFVITQPASYNSQQFY